MSELQRIKVFFSWQSERKSVSEFIRRTLEECCEELSKGLGVEIKVKDADSDNRGSYDINQAVMNAIKASDVVVADLTPTSFGGDGRANPNANALFEYATARAVKGYEKVLAVADVSEAGIGRFPFDFNHNSMVTFKGEGDGSFRKRLRDSLKRILNEVRYPVLYEATTVFFARRIAQSFPGVRGLRVYDIPNDIALHLDAFFQQPILFGRAVDPEGDISPIWWFRGVLDEAIEHYERLSTDVILLEMNELKIKRIAVFSNQSRYYSEYLYIEVAALPPARPKDWPEGKVERIVESLGVCDEAYGVVQEGAFAHKISGEEFDDGYAEVDGRIVYIRDKAKIRHRYLSPMNMLVAAKFSAYNCDGFRESSEPYFDGLLKGTVSLEDFHEYLMKFPKPPYRGR